LGVAGLAGCSGGGDGGDGSGNDDGGDSSGNNDGGGSSGNNNGGGSSEISIGILIGSSGPYSYLASVVNPAIDLMIERANNSDELLPDTDLSVTRYDTKGDPQEAQAGARELNQRENVNHFLGPLVAPTVNPVRNYVSSIDATVTTMLASAPFLTQDENCTKKLFRPGVTTQASIGSSGQWPAENIGSDGYVLTPDSSLGASFKAEVTNGAESAGGSIVGDASKASGSTDYSSVLSDIQNVNPDWLFMGMVGTGGLPFLQQAATVGLDVPMIVGLGEASLSQLQTEQFDRLGDMYRTTIWNDTWDTEGNDSFVSDFTGKADTAPTSSSASAFVSAETLIRMLHEAGGGGASVDDVISAGEGLEYETITGPQKIRACDHQGKGNVAVAKVTEIRDGGIGIERQELYDATEFYPSCSEIACSF
jgi:ABC-type branched-subunit amino acid transport system substrate-binding protein